MKRGGRADRIAPRRDKSCHRDVWDTWLPAAQKVRPPGNQPASLKMDTHTLQLPLYSTTSLPFPSSRYRHRARARRPWRQGTLSSSGRTHLRDIGQYMEVFPKNIMWKMVNSQAIGPPVYHSKGCAAGTVPWKVLSNAQGGRIFRSWQRENIGVPRQTRPGNPAEGKFPGREKGSGIPYPPAIRREKGAGGQDGGEKARARHKNIHPLLCCRWILVAPPWGLEPQFSP